MSSFLELAQLSAAVYGDVAAPAGWSGGGPTTGSYGFCAATYTKGGETVVAFRGTTGNAGDVAADLKLGTGMNTSHFGQAEDYIDGMIATGDLTLTGHSLGGAMAQVVGNRRNVKFATFNAPGVAVLASRNIASSTPAMFAVRAAGMLVSTVLHPIQAAEDVAATFTTVTGVNIRLNNDAVSAIGVHYGTVVSIPGTGFSPLSQHSIDTVVAVLRDNPLGSLTIADRA